MVQMGGFCQACGISPVVKVNKYGPMPKCDSCLDKSRVGRLERRAAKVRSGEFSSHYSKTGERFPDKTVPKEVTCFFCRQSYTRVSKPTKGRDVCPDCISSRNEERRAKGLSKVKALYWKDPKAIKRRRLTLTLKKAGLSIDWYDSQPKECRICGTEDPGLHGWNIDHDHRCCGYGNRKGCSKCIRGLLCGNCNLALGLFQDNPEILRKAIDYLEKSTSL